MTGPEHYREAERLERQAEIQYGDSWSDELHPQWTFTIQRAQVHATLALAAATIETKLVGTHRDWMDVVA